MDVFVIDWAGLLTSRYRYVPSVAIAQPFAPEPGVPVKIVAAPLDKFTLETASWLPA
ncbi:MAG: hypothetical protein JO079_02165 [Frankiaceae bacterium]|nr:hypothetical protein [Frankiaceae bacterium]MBV9370013.1 hypothetical protein [Frankiales bacterium]